MATPLLFREVFPLGHGMHATDLSFEPHVVEPTSGHVELQCNRYYPIILYHLVTAHVTLRGLI